MRTIRLVEYVTTYDVALDDDQLRSLRKLAPKIAISPSSSGTGRYDLTPGSEVGALWIDDLTLEIHPKVSIANLLFLISYGLDDARSFDDEIAYQQTDSVVEAVVVYFLKQVARATYRGLLHGYRTTEEISNAVRGQIRFRDQVRTRYGIAPPLEVTYDNFTEDIIENRLLCVALDRSKRMRLRSNTTARQIHEIEAAFYAVNLVEFTPSNIPKVTFTRLNEHYRKAIALATLILQSFAYDLGAGKVNGSGFLIDLNKVFERFVYQSLLESLDVPRNSFLQGKSIYLDDNREIVMRPDLSWWHDGKCIFVGDVKYKRVAGSGFKHPDIYQMLAYTTATKLESGLLIYADGDAATHAYSIPHAQKRIRIFTIQLDSPPDKVLTQIHDLANQIKHSAVTRRL